MPTGAGVAGGVLDYTGLRAQLPHRKSPQITASQYVWLQQITANRCWIGRKSPQIKTT